MNNGFLDTTQLDFASYKESLKQYLKQQDAFKDYDFEGSNMSVLLDILAYNTYMNGTYLNMVGSEMFLDTALLRESVVSHAKELNYTPRSRSSARAIVDITIDTANSSVDSVTIPKGYRVTGRASDGSRYNFVTIEPIIVSSANSFIANDVAIYEGSIVRETFVANTSTRYVLQSENIDASSIEVQVQESASNNATRDWKQATTLFGSNPSSEVFFVQGYEDFRYEVVFGNGVIGKNLKDGNIVRVSYRNTVGDAANGVRAFFAEQAIGGFSNISVSLTDITAPAFGGSEHETLSEIKFNAPRFFSTQERAITTSDFVTLIRAKFPFLEAITAYGGELAEPKQYGRVIISAKPVGSDVLSDRAKNEILKFIRDRASISVAPVFVDPNYFYVGVTSDVTYNVNKTTKTANDIKSLAKNKILSFSSEKLSDFGSDLRFSNLTAAIDQSDSSIVSNNTKAVLIKRLLPFVAVPETFTILFDNPMTAAGFNISQTAIQPVISSTAFVYSLNDILYDAFLQDDGLGGLIVYTVDINNRKQILNNNAGAVDYTTGKVIITDFVTQGFSGNSLKISARLKNSDIETNNNKILLIDDEDVIVNATGIRI